MKIEHIFENNALNELSLGSIGRGVANTVGAAGATVGGLAGGALGAVDAGVKGFRAARAAVAGKKPIYDPYAANKYHFPQQTASQTQQTIKTKTTQQPKDQSPPNTQNSKTSASGQSASDTQQPDVSQQTDTQQPSTVSQDADIQSTSPSRKMDVNNIISLISNLTPDQKLEILKQLSKTTNFKNTSEPANDSEFPEEEPETTAPEKTTSEKDETHQPKENDQGQYELPFDDSDLEIPDVSEPAQPNVKNHKPRIRVGNEPSQQEFDFDSKPRVKVQPGQDLSNASTSGENNPDQQDLTTIDDNDLEIPELDQASNEPEETPASSEEPTKQDSEKPKSKNQDKFDELDRIKSNLDRILNRQRSQKSK